MTAGVWNDPQAVARAVRADWLQRAKQNMSRTRREWLCSYGRDAESITAIRYRAAVMAYMNLKHGA